MAKAQRGNTQRSKDTVWHSIAGRGKGKEWRGAEKQWQRAATRRKDAQSISLMEWRENNELTL